MSRRSVLQTAATGSTTTGSTTTAANGRPGAAALDQLRVEHVKLDKSPPKRSSRVADDTVEIPRLLAYDDALPQRSRCETDPEMYQVFAYAVLGWHRRLPKSGGDVCRCGKPWLSCEYVDLADKLLWTGAASWSTGPANP